MIAAAIAVAVLVGIMAWAWCAAGGRADRRADAVRAQWLQDRTARELDALTADPLAAARTWSTRRVHHEMQAQRAAQLADIAAEIAAVRARVASVPAPAPR